MDRTAADNEIRARLAAGDSTALEMIWDLYASDMLGYLVAMLGSRHDAEDVLQDVFVTVARKRTSVARARKLKPYLFRLARNVALNRIKRGQWLREHAEEIPDWLVPAGDDTPSDDRPRQLATALAELPRQQRVVIVLKFFRDLTFREIAELLGISQNTAGSRYRYGIAKLKDIMREVSP